MCINFDDDKSIPTPVAVLGRGISRFASAVYPATLFDSDLSIVIYLSPARAELLV